MLQDHPVLAHTPVTFRLKEHFGSVTRQDYEALPTPSQLPFGSKNISDHGGLPEGGGTEVDVSIAFRLKEHFGYILLDEEAQREVLGSQLPFGSKNISDVAKMGTVPTRPR